MSLELPPIESLKPSEIAPQPAKSYPHAYLKKLVIESPNLLKSTAIIQLQNYNRDTKELSPLPEDMNTITINNVFTEAARVPLLGQAVGLIVTLVDLLVKEKKLQAAIAQTRAAGQDATALEASLREVQLGLGMTFDADA